MSLRDASIFIATSYVPRALLTRFMGWFSRLEQPLVRDTSMAVWRRFEHVDLSDAADRPYRSLHAIFTRSLRPGARPFDARPDVLASPCDGIVTACGRIRAGQLVQAKGLTYTLAELVKDEHLAEAFRDGTYATLRLTPAMYHRFHAPHDCQIAHVRYVPGDVWNTHPATLARVPRLYCKNERAVLVGALTADDAPFALVAVGSVLVASIRLSFLDVRLHLRYRGDSEIPCEHTLTKGEEMGYFEHGSTIIVLAPAGSRLAPGVESGARLRAGQALMLKGAWSA